MKNRTYTKKIVSLNPNRYEYKRLDELIDLYSSYIVAVTKGYTNGKTPKGFDKWLDTEI